MGAQVTIHDPYLAEYQGDIAQAAQNCHAAVVMVRHSEYVNLDTAAFKDLLRLPVLIDGRGIYNNEDMQSQGYTYRGVGVG
jgi:UDP-N-acetyl-D-mannosaminuronate dehydrogenase